MAADNKTTNHGDETEKTSVERLEGEVVDTSSGEKVRPGRGSKKRTDGGTAVIARQAGEKVLQVLKSVGAFLLMVLKLIGALFVKLFYFLLDKYEDYRAERQKIHRRRMIMKRKLSPEAYQEFMKKERLKDILRAAVFALAAVLLALLLFFAGRGIGRMFGKLFGGRQPKPAVQIETETETESETEQIFEEKTITVGSTGSMLLHSPFLTSYPDANGEYDFSSIYKFITPYYSAPDFMTCEFEGTLAGKEAGYSGYPNFKSPDIIIENIRDSGVDLQMNATNHVYDGSSVPFHRTMDVYDEKGIAYTGIRQRPEDKRYYVADIQGVKVGFMNYVYETKGDGVDLNGIPVTAEDGELINSYDADYLNDFYAEAEQNIRDMRADGVRFIFADMHWGIEYQLQESEEQRKIAQKLCDLGVDALIGGHPHCEQPIDVFTSADGSHNMFCIFSVGNALTNQRAYLMDQMPDGHTEDGVIINLTLHQAVNGKVSIVGVDMIPTWVYRFANNGSKYYIFALDDVEHLEETTGVTGIKAEAQASYERTVEELGPGLEKAKAVFETGTAAQTEAAAQQGA